MRRKTERKRVEPRRPKRLRRTRPPFSGRLIVVGGQCSKVGKTSLVEDLLRSFPELDWTAVKITPHAESGCPVNGEKCGCAPAQHTFVIRTEKVRGRKTDTSRFLAAGAKRAIWVQTKSGRLRDALAPLASRMGGAKNVIIESNAIGKHWRPDLFFLVLDPNLTDFKRSAQSVVRFTDAFVIRSPQDPHELLKTTRIPISGRPKFLQAIGDPLPTLVQDFVRQRFCLPPHHKA